MSITNKMPVLLFGSNIAAYGAIRGLAINHIPIYLVCHIKNSLPSYSRFVNKVFILDPSEDGFLDGLKKVAKQIGTEAVVIVAGADDYLDALSKNKSRLPEGFRCTFHGWDIVSKIRKKHITYQECAEIGVDFPKTRYVRSRDELGRVLSDLDIPFPVLLRSEESAIFLKEFGTKGIIAHNKDEVMKAYLKYKEFLGHLLLSEYIPGGEEFLVNLMAVADQKGRPIQVFMNRKVRSSNQFLGCTLMETYYSRRLLEDSTKLMTHFSYYGYFNSEFKIDQRTGSLKLMEVNGRITLSNSHALRCGLNLPYTLYECALGISNPQSDACRCRSASRVLWWDPANDFHASIRLFRQGKLSLGQYLKSLKSANWIIEPFWWKDPRVWGIWTYRFMRSFLARLGRRLCRK